MNTLAQRTSLEGLPSKDGTYKIRTQTIGEQKEGLLTKVKETTEGVAKMITKNNMFKDIDNYNKKTWGSKSRRSIYS